MQASDSLYTIYASAAKVITAMEEVQLLRSNVTDIDTVVGMHGDSQCSPSTLVLI